MNVLFRICDEAIDYRISSETLKQLAQRFIEIYLIDLYLINCAVMVIKINLCALNLCIQLKIIGNSQVSNSRLKIIIINTVFLFEG